MIIQGGNGGEKGAGRKEGGKTVPEKQICYSWARRVAFKKLWLTVLSDTIFLISKGKQPSTHLPTGKEFSHFQNYGYDEIHMQTHTLILHTCNGNLLKDISILLHLSAVTSQNM